MEFIGLTYESIGRITFIARIMGLPIALVALAGVTLSVKERIEKTTLFQTENTIQRNIYKDSHYCRSVICKDVSNWQFAVISTLYSRPISAMYQSESVFLCTRTLTWSTDVSNLYIWGKLSDCASKRFKGH